MSRQRQDWKRQVTKGDVTVLGNTVTFPKEGMPVIANRVFKDDVVGGLVEVLVNNLMSGKGKLDGQAAMDAIRSVGERDGMSAGRVARHVLGHVVPLVVNVIADTAEMADDAEREEFREWVRSLDLRPLFDLLAGYVSVQFPDHYGPFVDLAARGLLWLEETKGTLQASLAKAPDAPAGTAETQAAA